MNIYESEMIRNIAVLGHSGSGKSILKDAILFSTGQSENPPIYEKASEVTSDMNLFTVEWKDYKYNFIDTPGYSSFYSEVVSGISAAAGAIIIVDGTQDIQVGTDRALEITDELNMPKILFVNKIDLETSDYYKILEQLRERYGKKIAPFQVPIGTSEDFKGYVNVVELFAREYDKSQERCFTVDIPKDMSNEINEVREMLIESVAESDDTLLEKYFSGHEFDRDEIHLGLKKAVINGDLIPVFVGSTLKNIGVHSLMWMAKDYFPSPVDSGYDKDNDIFAGQVFKTIIKDEDNKISLLKVLQGKLSTNIKVYNSNSGNDYKITDIYSYTSGELNKISEANTGDIVAIKNINSLNTSDTLSVDPDFVPYKELIFPKTQMLSRIQSKDISDSLKLVKALKTLQEEDKALVVEVDKERNQTVIGTLGQLHAEIIVKKLKDKFGIDAELKTYKVPYRESIKSSSVAEVKLNRQIDDRGEFAQISLEVEPIEDGIVFEDLVQGSVIPPHFTPAIESGVREAVEEGVLGGYPVINVKVKYLDGAYSPTDSNDAVFKEAAKLAFKKAMSQAKPILLEPIMKLHVTSNEDNIGDVMGDISKRRGKILGMEAADKLHNQSVIAEVPQRELLDYLGVLSSMTSGKGFFDMEYLKHEEVPEKVVEEIIKDDDQ